MGKRLAIALSILVVTLGGLTLTQMWFELFDAEMFMKLMITLSVIGGVILVVVAIFKDIGHESDMKKKNLVD